MSTEAWTKVVTATHGYMVAYQGARCVGVAELDGDQGWQVYHQGEIIAERLTADEARDKLRTLPAFAPVPRP